MLKDLVRVHFAGSKICEGALLKICQGSDAVLEKTKVALRKISKSLVPFRS